ncbi:hypothetical protein [Alkalihalobacterium alkalinitrilicum]|uniref:hypothetical protein n=1 Tax=Alkalihalobacterium alkalinitrilicum TaxID=427920 RepID=UPI0009948E54|nr:hypothetical protein [Alkalihalobacterium alkalinitrilicum]
MKKLIPFLLVGCISFISPVVQAAEDFQDIQIVPIYGNGIVHVSVNKDQRLMNVNHDVKGSDVYVECVIDQFTFAKEKAGKNHVDGEGHLHLFVDGQKVDSIYQAAFIIKGLPSGEHSIKLELVKNDDEPYGVSEEFSVQVP